MPTLVGTTKVDDVAKDSQKISLSFNLSKSQQAAIIHTVRPFVMPNVQPTAAPSQSAILDTAIFVAE
jgi:hypothetical protein